MSAAPAVVSKVRSLALVAFASPPPVADESNQTIRPDTLIADKGWVLELDLAARIVDVWSARPTRGGHAKVTTVPLENVTGWQEK